MARVEELLEEAAQGRLGVDRRLIGAILESADVGAVLRFARANRETDRLDLAPLVIDLLRYFGSPEALDVFLDAVRRAPEDVSDDLIEAVLPFAERAVGPLLELYEEAGEEQGSDIAFLLACLRVKDQRVLAVLEDRLDFDAADGAFCLGVYADPAAQPALERMFAEIPEEDVQLRREFSRALAALAAPQSRYEAEPFDILEVYPEREIPAFDVLTEAERLAMLGAPDADVRAGAAYSFFNAELNVKSRAALLACARADSDPAVRGRAWQSLADAVADDHQDASIREALTAVLNDESKPAIERGGAAVGLYHAADREDVRQGIQALYEMNGLARAKALESMWRSLWEPYAKYFPSNLASTDPGILRQALRGAGYFRLTRCAEEIARFFDRVEPYDDLREDALFAYALAMPGETTRGRVRGMLRKIDALTKLTADEAELVEFALDERLRLCGLAPVFSEGEDAMEPEAPALAPKAGRNDPCPCGSGKKFKKCCGR